MDIDHTLLVGTDRLRGCNPLGLGRTGMAVQLCQLTFRIAVSQNPGEEPTRVLALENQSSNPCMLRKLRPVS